MNGCGEQSKQILRLGVATPAAYQSRQSKRFFLVQDDPAYVPSFELLQLFWELRRIMTIDGVANLENLSDHGGSDGDI
jgi:hypothetical protein